jgi:serine/threonine protein phosphatase 1
MTQARTFVIGDIHGCATELERLLDGLAPAASDTLIFLGDYIDRGPYSKAVIDRLIRLRREGPTCVFLKGNHEDMFLAFLGEPGHYGEAFLFNGGEATLRSYGLEGELGQLTAADLPPEHVDFLRALQLQHQHGRFLCVHAGVVPTRPLTEQRVEDLLWIRDEFIANPHPFPFTVLFGHTPQRRVLFHLPYKIGLDTGLVYWNKLSCLELEGRQLFQIRRGEQQVQSCSMDEELAQVDRQRVDRRASDSQERNRQGAQ